MGTGSSGPVNFHLLIPPKMISPASLVRETRSSTTRCGSGGLRTKVVCVTAQSEAKYRRLYHPFRDH